LNLNFNAIGPIGAQDLAKALKSNQSLKILQLSHNRIGTGGAGALAEALKLNNCLEELYIAGNYIGIHGIAHFDGIGKNIQAVDLVGDFKGDLGVLGISNAIKINSTLKVIDLEENSIGNSDVKLLAQSLKDNSTLEFINLSKNLIGSEGGKAIGKALINNKSLRVIKLRQNQIGKESSNYFDRFLNIFGLVGGTALTFANLVRVNRVLQEIDLSANCIQEKDAFCMIKALKDNLSLCVFNLEENNISLETLQNAIPFVERNTNILKKELRLCLAMLILKNNESQRRIDPDVVKFYIFPLAGI
jgi:NLR family CARD domain-containing protein 3